jgi:hypothetical protein
VVCAICKCEYDMIVIYDHYLGDIRDRAVGLPHPAPLTTPYYHYVNIALTLMLTIVSFYFLFCYL